VTYREVYSDPRGRVLRIIANKMMNLLHLVRSQSANFFGYACRNYDRKKTIIIWPVSKSLYCIGHDWIVFLAMDCITSFVYVFISHLPSK